MRYDSICSPSTCRTNNRLIDVGLVLATAAPTPPIKSLGIAAVGAGLLLELLDEVQRRKHGSA